MTNKDREQVIQNALRDYRYAKASGDKQKISFELNNLDNVYFMCSIWGTKGINEVQMILRENIR
jgi:hypothetical protein